MSDDLKRLHDEAGAILEGLLQRFGSATETMHRVQLISGLLVVLVQQENKMAPQERDKLADAFCEGVKQIAVSMEIETDTTIPKRKQH